MTLLMHVWLFLKLSIQEALDKLESECDIALEQIDERMYAKEYEDDYDDIMCYGISFLRKDVW